MHFNIITVVYNQLISNCGIVKQFTGVDFSTNLIFADNSTKEEISDKNKDFCLQANYSYVNMHGNYGLSKAYNKALSDIKKEKESWVIICDQDTEITEDFLKYYKNSIEFNPDKLIFCPIINDTVGIMSPSVLKGKKYKHTKITDFNRTIEKYSFINSCMCINSTVFESIQYDEKLFLDCVDHDFVKTVRKAFSENVFYVISELELFQNFSGVTKNSCDSDVIRFQIYLKDARYFYKKWYKSARSANIYLLFRALKLSLLHKNFVFLKLFMNIKI